MRTFLALSVFANLLLGITLNGVISDWGRYIAADEKAWKQVLQLVEMNSAQIVRMRETVANARAKQFVLCMRREKSVERCRGPQGRR